MHPQPLETEKKQKLPKRYFHVSFNHERGFGSIQYICVDGKYPTLRELKEASNNDCVKKSIILNIIEMSESDFNTFISET